MYDEKKEDYNFNYTYIFGLTGLVVSIIGLYYTRKQFILEEKDYKNEEPAKPQSIPTKKIWICLIKIKYVVYYNGKKRKTKKK